LDTIAAQLNELLTKGKSAEEATDVVMRDLRNADNLMAMVRPLVYNAAKTQQRLLTRALEDVVFSAPSRPQGRTPDQTPGDSDALLNGSTFHILPCPEFPGGGDVFWTQATPAEHRLRAIQQFRRARTTREDAIRHVAAAALIESTHRARCLGDVEDWEDAILPFMESINLDEWGEESA